MKILIVAPQPFFAERGTPIAVRALAKSLADGGHDVDLLVYHCGDDVDLSRVRIVRAGAPPGIRHVPIGISLQKLACDVLLVKRMSELLARNRYDVIHAVEEAVFAAVLLNRRHRARVIYDMDSLMSQQLLEKWTALRWLRGMFSAIERFAIQRCDAVLAVCDDLAHHVRQVAPTTAVRVLCDVPIENDGACEFQNERIAGAGLTVLYVGNLEHYQGVDELVQAMQFVPRDVAVKLVIVGGLDEHIAACRQLVPAGQADRIAFLGPRPLDQLDSLLSQGDILVSPRRWGQNTPMKIYSYMHSGKAIVATDIRAHRQVLDEHSAVLVEPAARALAAGITRLAHDAKLRARLGQAAARRVQERHSIDVFRRTIRETYEALGSA